MVVGGIGRVIPHSQQENSSHEPREQDGQIHLGKKLLHTDFLHYLSSLTEESPFEHMCSIYFPFSPQSGSTPIFSMKEKELVAFKYSFLIKAAQNRHGMGLGEGNKDGLETRASLA